MNPFIKHIFFDLDGTLTDPKEGITKSIQFALEQLDLPWPAADDLEWCIGPPLKESLIQLVGNNETLLHSAITHYRTRYSEIGWKENVVYSGVASCLSELKDAGYTLYVATSKPDHIALKILEHFDLAHYFKEIYGSKLDGRHSHKSDLLKHILQVHAIVEPSLMVGDRKFDIVAALENAIEPLGVTYGYGSPEELRQAGAVYLCHTPMEVCQWVSS